MEVKKRGHVLRGGSCLREAAHRAYLLQGCLAVFAGEGCVLGQAGYGLVVGVGEGVFYRLDVGYGFVFDFVESVELVVPRVFVAGGGCEDDGRTLYLGQQRQGLLLQPARTAPEEQRRRHRIGRHGRRPRMGRAALLYGAAARGGFVEPLGVVCVKCGGEYARAEVVAGFYREHFFVYGVGVGGVRCGLRT